MSAINTGSINVNYPIPGTNNSSQGFRDNFTGIKNNIDIAQTELEDLQSKAVVKSALTNSTLNNDMANTLISNAAVLGFRSTTYNLGNNVSGGVTVDVTRGDVQYATITGNVTLSFTKWAPSGTQANVQVILNISPSTPNAAVSFPTNVNSSKLTLENWNPTANSVVAANGVTQLHYNFSTVDCGTTITVEPVNRPRRATQVITTPPTSNIGRIGDRSGAIASDTNYFYICTSAYDGTTAIWKRVPLSAW